MLWQTTAHFGKTVKYCPTDFDCSLVLVHSCFNAGLPSSSQNILATSQSGAMLMFVWKHNPASISCFSFRPLACEPRNFHRPSDRSLQSCPRRACPCTFGRKDPRPMLGCHKVSHALSSSETTCTRPSYQGIYSPLSGSLPPRHQRNHKPHTGNSQSISRCPSLSGSPIWLAIAWAKTQFLGLLSQCNPCFSKCLPSGLPSTLG